MKKEIRKMYVYAILKIVLAVLLYALVICVCIREDDLAATITCGILFGIAALIYIASGILTIKGGERQIKEYMKSSGLGKKQLDAEYDGAKNLGRVHVGNVHVFANASNGFYILPLDSIEKIWVEHYSENRRKGRHGYYYLHIQSGICENQINVYYLLEGEAQEALEHIQCRVKCDTV